MKKNSDTTDAGERILKIDYEDEMKKSYIDYAMSVIIDRALPDVRDGFKPVHRRILFTMHEGGLWPDKPYRKAAKTVGDVLGRYHPHGDSSVYDAMVRLAQDFNMMAPLVNGHGNFGSIDGDSAAAYRYTESKLMPIAMELLGDLEKDVVDMNDNFDGSRKEPSVLPARFPNLLVNGSSGIAVGMATNIPSHNLVEVIKGVGDYMDNPEISVERLMKSIKGPDFPTGGIIVNRSDLRSIYETGMGKLRIRAKIEVENSGYGKTNLVVTEVPNTWTGNKTKQIEKILDMIREGRMNELSDIRDESSRDGIRIVMEVKKGVSIDRLLTKLYKKTTLEDTMSVNCLALVKGRPEVLNLKQMIACYVDFQKEVNIRKYNFLLQKADKRREILEGLIRAHDVIDTIIEIIRGSRDTHTVRECMMHGTTAGIQFKSKAAQKEAAKFDFSETQTNAILSMQLQSLIGLELLKLNTEYDEIQKSILEYRAILSDEKKLLAVIKGYLDEIKKKYGVARRTHMDDIETVEYVEEFVEEELMVLVDRFGYIKSVDMANFNRANEETIKEFRHVLASSNTDRICVFTQSGNLYQIKTAELPKGKIKDKGVPIETLVKMGREETVLITTFNRIRDKRLFFTTRSGLVKITEGSEFESVRTLTSCTKLDEGDEVADLIVLEEPAPIHQVIISELGYVLKYEVDSVTQLKKNSKGIKSIVMSNKDKVKAVYFLKDKEAFVVQVNGKDVDLSKMRTKKRNQPGVKQG